MSILLTYLVVLFPWRISSLTKMDTEKNNLHIKIATEGIGMQALRDTSSNIGVIKMHPAINSLDFLLMTLLENSLDMLFLAVDRWSHSLIN
mgnify:FL=1